MKILLAVPTFENILPDTFKSLWDMDRAEHEVEFETVRGYDCAMARNVIAQMAIDRKTDYVLMVDSDVIVPKDVLINLLEDPVDVCFGYCPRRSDHSVSSMFPLFRPDGKPNVGFADGISMNELRASEKKRIQVRGGGTGCVLIKTDLFRRIKKPWFNWVNDPDGATVSEDLFFCDRVKKAGFPMYVDTRVACGHSLRNIYW